MNRIPKIILHLGYPVVVLLLAVSCATTSPKPRSQAWGGAEENSRAVVQGSPAPRAEVMPPVSGNGVTAREAPAVLAGSYILVDVRGGKTIAQKNADSRRPVASTQKLLTALLVLERGGLDRTVKIAYEDTFAPPSKMYLKTGQSFTRRELLTVFLVKSANDAAHALARDHSGSIAAFAAAMNRKARQLGAHNSNFVNPHGLTEGGQYSTARDMARIALAAYREPFVRRVARMQGCSVRGKTYKATNKLLKKMPECTGLKTGYTRASGRCLISTARFQDAEVLLVQLGSKESVIWNDATRLMRWGRRQRAQPWRYAGAAF